MNEIQSYLLDSIRSNYIDFIQHSRKLARETAELAESAVNMTPRLDRLSTAVDQSLVSKVEDARTRVAYAIDAAYTADISRDDIEQAVNVARVQSGAK